MAGYWGASEQFLDQIIEIEWKYVDEREWTIELVTLFWSQLHILRILNMLENVWLHKYLFSLLGLAYNIAIYPLKLKIIPIFLLHWRKYCSHSFWEIIFTILILHLSFWVVFLKFRYFGNFIFPKYWYNFVV